MNYGNFNIYVNRISLWQSVKYWAPPDAHFYRYRLLHRLEFSSRVDCSWCIDYDWACSILSAAACRCRVSCFTYLVAWFNLEAVHDVSWWEELKCMWFSFQFRDFLRQPILWLYFVRRVCPTSSVTVHILDCPIFFFYVFFSRKCKSDCTAGQTI